MVSMVVSGFTMGLSTNQPCFMPNHMSCRGESSQPLCDTSLVWINTYIIIYYIIDIIYKHICTYIYIYAHVYVYIHICIYVLFDTIQLGVICTISSIRRQKEYMAHDLSILNFALQEWFSIFFLFYRCVLGAIFGMILLHVHQKRIVSTGDTKGSVCRNYVNSSIIEFQTTSTIKCWHASKRFWVLLNGTAKLPTFAKSNHNCCCW